MSKNTWVQHIKLYAKNNNITYKEAMKNKQCKTEYLKLKVKKGKGFKDTIKRISNNVNKSVNKQINITKAILKQKWGLNNQFEDTLNHYGDCNIVKLEIIRIPLSKALNTVLNLITLGKVNQEMVRQDVDHLYHLKMEIILDNGSKLTLEKDGTSKLFVGGIRNDTQQPMEVKLHHPIKLKDFIENTIKLMNLHNYTHYNSVSNNCQHFVQSHLEANGLLTQQLKDFLNQDEIVKELFNKQQKNLIKTTTDLNGAVLTVADNII